MARLFIRLLKYGGILAGLMLLLFFGTGLLTKNHRLGTTAIKQQRLQEIASPKLILIGGSNLFYGLNSSLLADSIGLEVVNMGIQGSIGLKFYFEEIHQHIKEGDIVVLLPENAHYLYIDIDGEQPLYNLVSKYPAAAQHLSFQQALRAPLFLGTSIKENLQYLLSLSMARYRGQPTIYEQTDKRGDYLGHRDKPSIFTAPQFKGSGQPAVINPEVLHFLRQEQLKLTKKGAEFFIGFAPIAQTVSDPGFLQQMERALQDNFPEHTLGNGKQYILPDQQFFDTHYHLMFDARDYRTSLLLHDLRNNPIAREVLDR